MAMADVEEAGRRLWALWRERRRIERLPPGLHPATEDEGYAVQDALVRAAALPLAGWKIGATSAHARRRLGLPGPVSGRLFAPFVFRAPAALTATDYVGPSLEPEFAFRMARDLPPRAEPYRRDEVAAAIGALLLAIELVECRWTDWETVGAPGFIADDSAAAALVCGPEIAEWRSFDLPGVAVSLELDGAVAARGRGADVMGDPLEAMTWLANHLCARGLRLRSGELVTSGTCTPIVAIAPGQSAVARFEGVGAVELRLSGRQEP